jgi:hypothetical protein
MRVSRKTQVRIPWFLVAAFLICAVITAFGFALGNFALAVTGAVIVVASGLLLMIGPRLGISDRVSFAADFPNTTRGPRGSAHDGPAPPVDSDPQRRHFPGWPQFHMMGEVHTGDLPEGPDDQPAWPQYVNLAPGQHVRTIGGREFIERDVDDAEDVENAEDAADAADGADGLPGSDVGRAARAAKTRGAPVYDGTPRSAGVRDALDSAVPAKPEREALTQQNKRAS